MRYETPEDRARQARLKPWLEWLLIDANGWPITVKETARFPAESHDFEFHSDKGVVGVAEAKCRKGKYTEAYFKREGLLVERERFEALKGAWFDIGALVLLVLMTADNKIYVISFNELEPLIPKLRLVGSWMLKDDHGRKKTDKSGYILPLKHMTYLGECDE